MDLKVDHQRLQKRFGGIFWRDTNRLGHRWGEMGSCIGAKGGDVGWEGADVLGVEACWGPGRCEEPREKG